MTKNRSDKIDKVWYYIERLYPSGLAFAVVIIYFLSHVKFRDSFSDILSACLSFCSIMIGFIGVLMALLFSLNKNAIKDFVFKNAHYERLIFVFFRTPIQTGFIFIILSLLLYLRNTLASMTEFQTVMTYLIDTIKTVWIFTFVLFTTSSYRLIRIVLRIVFYKSEVDDDEPQEEEQLDTTSYAVLQEKYAITKGNSNGKIK